MLHYVNPLQGTDSRFDLSLGNTLPLIAAPWGMNHWTLQTDEGTWAFHPDSPKLQGIRLTHQPSPWIGDYGALTFLPFCGPIHVDAKARSSAYRIADTVLHPHYLKAHLLRYNVHIELTPTTRGGIFRMTFSDPGAARFLIQPLAGESWIRIEPQARRVIGYTRGNHGGAPSNFACYFVMELNCAIDGVICLNQQPQSDLLELAAERVAAAISFKNPSGQIEARIATSFISVDQARLNLQREVAHRSFDDIRTHTSKEWERALGRIHAESDDIEQIRTLYSCMYRCHLFPRIFHEQDSSGSLIHYSPYDGKIHSGPLYTDNGFWDTYRTLYPLLCMLDPERVGEMLAGYLNAYQEGGWLPQWASPGYRACMVGTHSDAVLAHAIACGIPGFDYHLAYEAMRKNVTVESDTDGCGRTGMQEYETLGYLPADHFSHATSRTLDYAYNDWCVAQVARRLGHHEDADLLLRRSQNYRHVFDQKSGFMRGRLSNGSWQEPFDPFTWGGPYIEGGAWQSTWAVPHDPQGLIYLMGGREMFIRRLEQMLSTPPHFNIGTYPIEIHEMTEMALARFGQYAHSNQPVHHVLYLFAAAGAADKTALHVHRVMAELYNSSRRGLPGDEDNGEMSAWYVLSALGRFPLCPGKNEFINIPSSFKHIELIPRPSKVILSHTDDILCHRVPARFP